MGLVPLTLKNIAWPERRVVVVSHEFPRHVDVITRALGVFHQQVYGQGGVAVILHHEAISVDRTAIFRRHYAPGCFEYLGIGFYLRRIGNHRSLLEAVFSRLCIPCLRSDLVPMCHSPCSRRNGLPTGFQRLTYVWASYQQWIISWEGQFKTLEPCASR